MKRLITTVALTASATLVGCSNTQSANTAAPCTLCTQSTVVAYGDLGPADASADGTFYLGAGDALGQEIFTYYVASLRAQEYYATGENLFPSE